MGEDYNHLSWRLILLDWATNLLNCEPIVDSKIGTLDEQMCLVRLRLCVPNNVTTTERCHNIGDTLLRLEELLVHIQLDVITLSSWSPVILKANETFSI